MQGRGSRRPCPRGRRESGWPDLSPRAPDDPFSDTVIAITENHGYYNPPMYASANYDRAVAESVAVPVQPGELTIQAQVQVIFAFGQ